MKIKLIGVVIIALLLGIIFANRISTRFLWTTTYNDYLEQTLSYPNQWESVVRTDNADRTQLFMQGIPHLGFGEEDNVAIFITKQSCSLNCDGEALIDAEIQHVSEHIFTTHPMDPETISTVKSVSHKACDILYKDYIVKTQNDYPIFTFPSRTYSLVCNNTAYVVNIGSINPDKFNYVNRVAEKGFSQFK